MPVQTDVSRHYTHGDLIEAIRAGIVSLGKTADTVTVDDLAPVDEFHIGGRKASEDFLDQLGFRADKHVLDVGCGDGTFLRHLPSEIHVFGYEPSQAGRQSLERHNISYLDFLSFSRSFYIVDISISKRQRLSFPRKVVASLYAPGFSSLPISK